MMYPSLRPLKPKPKKKKKAPEAQVKKKLEDHVKKKYPQIRLWTNASGFDSTRNVRYGLAVGSSDKIGILPTVITPEMVGKTLGIFCAIELKAARGRVSEAQQEFIDKVLAAGGIAGIVKTNADFDKLIAGRFNCA